MSSTAVHRTCNDCRQSIGPQDRCLMLGDRFYHADTCGPNILTGRPREEDMSDLVADMAMQIAQTKAMMAKQHAEIERLYEALDRSVKLQSHYALLLNMNDGGARKRFDDGDSWLKRLQEVDQKGEQTRGA